MKESFVYILTNQNRTIFYTGVTADLVNRIKFHLKGKGSVFCRKYNINILVYNEKFMDISDAIIREKQIKKYKKEWKMNLIHSRNPEMKDLLIHST